MKRLLCMTAAALALTACTSSSNNSPAPAAPQAQDNPLPKAYQPEATPAPIARNFPAAILDVADGLSSELKQSCATSICGAPSTTTPTVASAKLTTDIMNDLTPLIQQSIQAPVDARATVLKSIAAAQNQFSTLDLTSEDKSFINFMWAIRYLKPALGAYDGKSFDHGKLVGALQLSDDDVSSIETILTDYFHDTDLQIARYVEQVGIKETFQYLAQTSDSVAVKKLIRDYATDVVTRLGVLQRTYPVLTITLDQGLLDLASGKEIDALRTDQFAQALRTVALDTVITNSELYSKHTPDIKEALDYFSKVAVARLQPTDIQTQVSDAITARTQSCAITAKEIGRIKPLEPSAVGHAKAFVEQVRYGVLQAALQLAITPAQKETITAIIGQAPFEIPDSTSVALQTIKASLKSDISHANDALVLSKTADAKTLLLSMVAMSSTSTPVPNEPALPCFYNNPGELTDRAMISLGAMSLSWSTIVDPPVGYGIVAHEFGHIVSSIFQDLDSKADVSKFYDATYACVNQRKISIPQPSSQEEDFADLFSSRVIDILEARGVQTTKLGCTLMGTDGVRWGSRFGLSMIWPNTMRDSHSTEFFRAIQVELNRGHALSPACSSIVQQTFPGMTNQCVISP